MTRGWCCDNEGVLVGGCQWLSARACGLSSRAAGIGTNSSLPVDLTLTKGGEGGTLLGFVRHRRLASWTGVSANTIWSGERLFRFRSAATGGERTWTAGRTPRSWQSGLAKSILSLASSTDEGMQKSNGELADKGGFSGVDGTAENQGFPIARVRKNSTFTDRGSFLRFHRQEFAHKGAGAGAEKLKIFMLLVGICVSVRIPRRMGRQHEV